MIRRRLYRIKEFAFQSGQPVQLYFRVLGIMARDKYLSEKNAWRQAVAVKYMSFGPILLLNNITKLTNIKAHIFRSERKHLLYLHNN